jgi:hypothetical protein
MQIQALFTGSRVYGKPNKKSDIDLVILIPESTMKTLVGLADNHKNILANVQDHPLYGTFANNKSVSLRFGRMNIIAVTCPILYATWIEGTEQLKYARRKTGLAQGRQRAVNTFKKLWREHNV